MEQHQENQELREELDFLLQETEKAVKASHLLRYLKLNP